MPVNAIVWSNELATGLDSVDSQHQHLIGLINVLGELHAGKAPAGELIAVLDQLGDYTRDHFQNEANLMQAWAVDPANRAAHLKAHDGFIDRIGMARTLISEGTVNDVVDYLLAFLVKWLVHHITGVDARMAKEIHALRTGAALSLGAGRSDSLHDKLIDTVSDLYDTIGSRTFEMLALNRRLADELELRLSAQARLQLAASVFSHAREGIMITDADGTIIDINEAFTRITGYARDAVIGRNPRILKSSRQPPEFYDGMWLALKSAGYWSGETWNRRQSGEEFPELLTISAVRDECGVTRHYVALFTDITAIKQHHDELEHTAHYDALTALPNRLLMSDRLTLAISQCERRKQSLAVVYIDLDGFKAVNDRHGHQAGDELLVTVAQRMKTALREGDTLARIGGDEFVAVLVDLTTPMDCEPVLSRLLVAASDPVLIGKIRVQVSASIGVTIHPNDGADADKLLRHADQAMYQAKQAGKNRYQLFDVAQDFARTTRHELLEQLRQAITNDELVLYYQPKVNLRTGKVIGAEALVRWRHPIDGLLLPAAFLPVIENHPLNVELGEWVIRSALAQVAAWHSDGADIPVSVNIGARHLQEENFVARLIELLAAHPELGPGSLELELLETSALDDIDRVSALMHDCKEIGVHFALDDFGTGYSSLTYLQRLPASVLKIDQSFVADMLKRVEGQAIIEGVMGLASAFRRTAIAEGVESLDHGRRLLPLGCELAQGFGIGHPMPASEFASWADTWAADPAWQALTGQTSLMLN